MVLSKVPGLGLEGAGLREWLGGMTGPPGVDGGGNVQEGLQGGGTGERPTGLQPVRW